MQREEKRHFQSNNTAWIDFNAWVWASLYRLSGSKQTSKCGILENLNMFNGGKRKVRAIRLVSWRAQRRIIKALISVDFHIQSSLSAASSAPGEPVVSSCSQQDSYNGIKLILDAMSLCQVVTKRVTKIEDLLKRKQQASEAQLNNSYPHAMTMKCSTISNFRDQGFPCLGSCYL